DEAVLVDRADIAGPQPASRIKRLARGRLVLQVAREDGLASDQELAVGGGRDLEPRQRRPDGAEAEAPRPVDRRGGRALGQTPALEDQQAERVEERRDLPRERRAAGD